VPTTIYTAASIITFNGYRPRAQAVAVRDGRILCVGTVEECQSWGEAVIDARFADKVLMPGMVEAHGHTAEASITFFPYVGFYDAPLPDGSRASGVRNYDELHEVLKAADAALPEGQILIANGFDPIFFDGQPRLDAAMLDRVSTTRPIFVRHASGHLATVNTALIEAENIAADTDTPGIVRDAAGHPTGELQEAPAMSLATAALHELMALNGNPDVLFNYGRLCRNAGVTTTTELVGPFILIPGSAQIFHDIVNRDDFPARMSVYNLPGIPGIPADYGAVAEMVREFQPLATDKLRLGGIKLIGDGSLQGWTACCGSPGYYTGEDHGLAQFTQEDLELAVQTFHDAGLQIYLHANGDATVDQFITAVDKALRKTAWLDHRHTAQHSQTTTTAQYRAMARLGIAANIFTNHMWYWGDQHYSAVMGPERVERMWAVKTAKDLGISVTYHSDSGVTPTSQLHTAWCAVNRVTPHGRVLGDAEKVDVETALRAVTIEAAYQLHMDHEIGTIEAGKLADFAVLESDPLECDPSELRDVKVWGTVVGGVIYEAEKVG
jgi:predicted amidohydrolase YtcJ